MPRDFNHLNVNPGVPSFNDINYPLIHHNPPMSMQQSFNQPWSGTLGWQDASNKNYNYGIQSASQQDFVPFDEDGDFYDNEEATAGVEASVGKAATPMLSRTSRQFSETPLVPASGFSPCSSAVVSSSTGNGQTAKSLANDRAAELRAKLIAQQRASGTPTPSLSKKKVESTTQNIQPHTSTLTASRGSPNLGDSDSLEQRQVQTTVVNRQHDKSSKLPHVSTLRVATSDADIEGLIAYEKAAADAKKSFKESTDTPAVDGLRKRTTTEWNAVQEQSAMIQPTSQRKASSSASAGASELGEIREDTPTPQTVQSSSKLNSPTTYKESKNKESTTRAKSLKLYSTEKDVAPVPTKEDVSTMTSVSNNTATTPGAHSKPRESERPTAALLNDPDIVSTKPSHDSAPKRQPSQQALHNRRGDDCREHSTNFHQQGTEALKSKQNQQGRNYRGEVFERNNHYQGIKQKQVSPPERNRRHDITATEYNGHDSNPLATRKEEAMHASSQSDETRPKMTPNEKLATTSQVTADAVHTFDAAPSVESPRQVYHLDSSMFASRWIFQDVTDWLEMTGFNNVSHRTRRLEIHRKKKALDIQRAELEREEQLALEQHSRSIRASSVRPDMTTDTNLSSSVFSAQAARASSVSRMLPPPLPLRDDPGIKIKDAANQSTSREVDNDLNSRLPVEDSSRANDASKRQHPPDSENRPDGHTNKIPRLDIGYKPQDTKPLMSPAIKDESLESRISRKPEPRSATYCRRSRSSERRHRSPSPLPRRTSDAGGYSGYRRDSHRADMYPPSTDRHTLPSRRNSQPTHPESQYETRIQDERETHYQRYMPNNSRGRGRGRGNSFANYRGGHKSYSSRAGMHDAIIGSDSLNLQDGDARYFMIKSWTAENVEIAQRDVSYFTLAFYSALLLSDAEGPFKSTWATQKKNLDILTEAYNSCRHVILFFSVNNSHAFQGYARMASAPGEAPTPVWAKDLIWESTPPFYIDWVSTNETRFNRCGNLKNSLNEGQPVLVGRDGQEIEAVCGRDLCKLMDNTGMAGDGEERRSTGDMRRGW